MKMNEQLRKLADMPEDGKMKARIYAKLQQPKKRQQIHWQELFAIVGIAVIALFLIIVPQIKQHSAATEEIKAIYTYYNGEEGKFRAKPSLLFTGMQDATSPTTVAFFNSIHKFPIVENGQLGSYISDVVVVRENVKQRYQISETTLYDVDHNKYYDISEYAEAFNELNRAKVVELLFVVPLGVIAVNLFGAWFYKRKGIKPLEKLPGIGVYTAVALIVLGVIIFYLFKIGPIWKPLLYGLTVVYGMSIIRLIHRNVFNLTIRRVEMLKAVIMMILLMLFIHGQ